MTANLGWVVWGGILTMAGLLTVNVLRNHREGKWFPSQIETVVLWWTMLGWTAFTPLHKLHLLWLAPLALFAPLSTWFAAIRRFQRPNCHPIAWLIALLVLLATLTYGFALTSEMLLHLLGLALAGFGLAVFLIAVFLLQRIFVSLLSGGKMMILTDAHRYLIAGVGWFWGLLGIATFPLWCWLPFLIMLFRRLRAKATHSSGNSERDEKQA